MQALQTQSNIGEMFNIQEKENGEIAISARELYKALEVKKRFSAWAEINLKHFKENRILQVYLQVRLLITEL